MLLLFTVAVTAQVNFDVTIAEKKRIVQGSEIFQKSDDEIFVNAMLWAINEGPVRKEEILDFDFTKHELAMIYNLKKDGDVAYTCRLTLRASSGRLFFLVNEIKIQGGFFGSFQNFDKLNPEKKAKHKDIINEFERLNNLKIQELFEYVSNNNPKITNWRNVCLGKIDKGMSVDEAILVYGKPINVQSEGNKEQYMFSSFVYVYIEDGLITAYVN